jgi:hypothetical protein
MLVSITGAIPAGANAQVLTSECGRITAMAYTGGFRKDGERDWIAKINSIEEFERYDISYRGYDKSRYSESFFADNILYLYDMFFGTTGTLSNRIASVDETDDSITVAINRPTSGFHGTTNEIFILEVNRELADKPIAIMGSGQLGTPPVISPMGGTFESRQTVSIRGPAYSTVYYTTDGSVPTYLSSKYTEPFELTKTATVRAIAMDEIENFRVYGVERSARFTKLPLYGDVNSDGVINSADVTMLKYYIASSDRPKFRADNRTFNFENARVAGGTDVTAADVSLLQLWIATPVNGRSSVKLGP